MSGRIRDLITIAIPAALALAFLCLWLTGTKVFPGTEGSYNVRVLAPQAASLSKAANVLIAGLPAGRVVSVERKGTSVLLELALQDDHAPIPRDSRFGVRLRTLVGENYVELYPGESKQMVPDGGMLPPSQANDYVEADQILDTLQGRTRERARALVQGLGAGVADRGPKLNRLLGGAAGAIEEAAPVTRVLDRDRDRLARLIDDLGEVSRAVGERGTAIEALARDGRITFQSIADRDDAVRAFLDEMPPTLRQVRGTTETVRAVTRDATPVLFDLAAAVREAEPAVRLLEPAALEGQAVVAELGRAAPPLQGTLRRLRALSSPTLKALPQVREVLCEVNPTAEYLSPYAQDVSTFVNNLSSVTNYYDANAHAARIFATIGPDSAAIYDEQTADAVDTLLEAGALGMQSGMGYHAQPVPGQNDDLTTGRGVRGPTDVQIPYERVRAEC